MKNNIYFCCLALLIGLTQCPAQIPTFSQYRALPYLLNPAMTGHLPAKRSSRFAVIARSHWNLPTAEPDGVLGAAVAWDWRSCKGDARSFFWGAGGFIQRDGTFGGGIHHTNLRGMAAASHKVWGDNNWLSLGASFGIMEYGINPEKLTFDGQWDPGTGDFTKPSDASGENFLQENDYSKNADVGLQYYAAGGVSEWSLGVTMHNLLNPAYYFAPPGIDREHNALSPGFSTQFNFLHTKSRVGASLFYWKQAMRNNSQWQARAELSKGFKVSGGQILTGGVQFRLAGNVYGFAASTVPNAMILLAELKGESGSFAVSWDFTLSRIGNRPPNGFELSFIRFIGQGRCPIDCP